MSNWTTRNLEVNWHPYTQMKDLEKHPPVLIERADGLKLFDDKGNYYYDTISSWWCNIHGHNHPYINNAVQKQLHDFGHVMFGGFTHKPAITLSERLVELAPKPLSRVFYSDNGSTAIEVALKMSLQYWQHLGNTQKTQFISFENAYHGDTIGTMSVSAVSLFHSIFKPVLFSSYKTPVPNKDDNDINLEQKEEDCLAQFENLLQKHHDVIAAFICEPLLMGAGGMIHYSANFLAKLRDLCTQYNIHMIADEVATGFGRTGTFFACEQANICPDFLCISKALTNGTTPLAATLTHHDIYQSFYADYNEHKTFYHGHTFTANAIGCAIANATLDIFEQEQTLSHVQTLAPYFHAKVSELNQLESIKNLRYLGMTAAFELYNPITKAPYPTDKRMGQTLYLEGLQHNVILRPLGNTLYLFLPLCCTKQDIDMIIEKTILTINKSII